MSLHAPTAYAAPGDPPTGSPAGAVYELPLEQGRADGAPKGGGGTSAGGGGGSATSGGGSTTAAGAAAAGEAGSLYRSENNFGSSSRVPGIAAATGGSSGGPGAAGGAAGAAGAGGAIAGAALAGEATDAGNTSVGGSIALLVAIALVAIAAGLLSRRYAQRQ